MLKVDTKNAKGKNLQDNEGYDDAERLETGHKCKNGWYELRPRGKLPEKRSYHSSVIYNGWLYIYGGEDSREGKYDSLWKLNLEEFIEIGEKGNKNEENKDLEDNPPEKQEDDGKLIWHCVDTKGSKPGPLSHHQAEIIGDQMFIFGGMKSDG